MNFDKYYGWFYINQNHRSPSWTFVKYLERFLLRDITPGFVAKILPISVLEVVDIIQIRQNPNEFNHMVIISKITPQEIYVCAHSNNVLDKALSEYFAVEMKGIHIQSIDF